MDFAHDDRAKRHAVRSEEMLTHLAAEFVARQSNGSSLITATRTVLSSRGDRAEIFVTVFPDDRKPIAMDFLKRQESEFRDYLKEHARLRNLPRIEFVYDDGEKNRQRMDELGREL